MKYLPKLITRLLSPGLSEAAVGEPSSIVGTGVDSKFASMWDEALMASMYDSNAQWLLDNWGHRGK